MTQPHKLGIILPMSSSAGPRALSQQPPERAAPYLSEPSTDAHDSSISSFELSSDDRVNSGEAASLFIKRTIISHITSTADLLKSTAEGKLIGSGTYVDVYTIEKTLSQASYVLKVEKSHAGRFSQADMMVNEAYFSSLYLKDLGNTVLAGDIKTEAAPRVIRQPRIPGLPLGTAPSAPSTVKYFEIKSTEQLFAACIGTLEALAKLHATVDDDGQPKQVHVYGDAYENNAIFDGKTVRLCDYGMTRIEGELTVGRCAPEYQPKRLEKPIPARVADDLESFASMPLRLCARNGLDAKKIEGLVATCASMQQDGTQHSTMEWIEIFRQLEAINYLLAHQDLLDNNGIVSFVFSNRKVYLQKAITDLTGLKAVMLLLKSPYQASLLKLLGTTFLTDLIFKQVVSHHDDKNADIPVDQDKLSKFVTSLNNNATAQYMLNLMAFAFLDISPTNNSDAKKALLQQLKKCIYTVKSLVKVLQQLSPAKQTNLLNDLGLEFLRSLAEHNVQQLPSLLKALSLIDAQNLFARLKLNDAQLQQFIQDVYAAEGGDIRKALAFIQNYCYSNAEQYRRVLEAFNQHVYIPYLQDKLAHTSGFAAKRYHEKLKQATQLNLLHTEADLKRHQTQLSSGCFCFFGSKQPSKLQALTQQFIAAAAAAPHRKK